MKCLNLLHPEGMKRQEADYCVFILDLVYFKELNYGKHKLKCLLDLCLDQKVDVYQGDMEDIPTKLINQFDIDKVVVQHSNLPLYRDLLKRLQSTIQITVIEDPLMMIDLKLQTASFFKFFISIEIQLQKKVDEYA